MAITLPMARPHPFSFSRVPGPTTIGMAAVGTLGLAAVCGAMAASHGVILLGAALGIIVCLVSIWRPFVGALAILFLAPVPWEVTTVLFHSSQVPVVCIVTVIVFVSFLINRLVLRLSILTDHLVVLGLAMTLICLISYAISSYADGFSIFGRVNLAVTSGIYPVVVVMIGSLARSRREQWQAVTTSLLGGVFCSLFGPLEFIRQTQLFSKAPPQYYGDMLRISSFLNGPTPFGIYLSICFAFLIGVLWYGSMGRGRTLLLAMGWIPLISLDLLLTFARGSWIICAIWAIISLIITQTRSARHIPKLIVSLSFIASLLIVVSPLNLLPQQIQGRLASVLSISSDDSAITRMERWEIIAPATMDSPWLGHGIAFVSDEVSSSADMLAGATPHNTYIYTAVANGIPALLIFLSVLGLGVIRIARFGRVLDRSGQCLLLCVAGVFFMIAAGGIFESVLADRQVQILFWAAVGLLCALTKRRDEASNATAVVA